MAAHAGVDRDAWLAVGAGVIVCVLTINAASFDGPLSRALGGADFTWTAGPLVAAFVYWAQSRRRSRARSTATARVSASSLR